jgi:BirA family biotin operon repressor/biotin-[acetyl-CoA-carboxylase] ligase
VTGSRLDGARLASLLGARDVAAHLHVLETVDSTNDELRRRAAEGAPPLTTIVADAQSAGRGRRDRGWHSPPALGLYVSVLFRPAGPALEVPRWTIAAAVAACRACRAVGGRDVGIKWPNDLVWRGRKLGGILTEARSVGASPVDLIVGTGLNVLHRAEDFPDELRGSATSLVEVAGTEVRRERLGALYLNELAALAGRLSAGDWAPVARAWLSMAPGWRDRPVRVARGGEAAWNGIARGLDESGALVVERETGERQTIHLPDAVSPLRD